MFATARIAAVHQECLARILLVDDDALLREAVGDVLADEGHAVAHAVNGAEALAYLRSHPPPDLVLLDLNMPVMDGWRCLREIRADRRLAGVPVVIVSAEPEDTVPVPAERFLRKPFNIPELLAIVSRNLGPRGHSGPRCL